MSVSGTRLTRLVGCRWPVQLAGMPRTSTPELVAAVADAGGLAMLGGARYGPDELASVLAGLARARDGAVGVTLLAPFLDAAALDVAARGARVVELFWGTPDAVQIHRIHAGGALASWQVGTLAEALAAERAGCDFVVLQGVEAGGHVRGTEPRDALLAQARDVLRVPVVVAGGIATPRDLTDALRSGADGVRCGTIFVAAAESGAHPDYQRALIEGAHGDTVITTAFSTGWPNAPHRVLRDCIAALENAPDPVAVIAEYGREVAIPRGATPNPTRATHGFIRGMPHYAGTSVGAVRAIRPAAAIVADLVVDLV
jgi:nitronate monooxygenase